ncbi:hypothetical protein [Spiroplasma alleghenense]|uniref:Uncharacterized protein n=1 Tax=Spiroplasma alleghenense TaxID=216931 RepID=A0A345Z3R6_9MOLU|nr:hypothetical protein [Spiroplasma alleghenense]AXK51245.1 hypothetical protein SALLE_v1c05730 [Spiroplasma alleghenense]
MKKDQYFYQMQSKYNIVSINVYVHLENLFNYFPDYRKIFKETAMLDKSGNLKSRGEINIEDVQLLFRALNFEDQNRYDPMFDINFVTQAPEKYKSPDQWYDYYRNNFTGVMKKIK